MKKDLGEKKKEENQERKVALEKNQRKRKNLDLDKLKNPHHNDEGFVHPIELFSKQNLALLSQITSLS